MPKKNVIRILTIVGLILLIPLFGNFFIDGWNWGVGDFIFAFCMLSITGFGLDSVSRKITRTGYRVLASTAIIVAFLFIWVTLATG